MNLLLYCESACVPSLPDFGPDFAAHIAEKKHPDVRRNSISAWKLLAHGLAHLGCTALPKVVFEETGRPVFADSPLSFSISHSGAMAAALISGDPCAVDIEIIRPEISLRLRNRCLSEQEKECGCDFFEVWTKKECIAKLDGRGMPARPSAWDSMDARYAGCFHMQRIVDSAKSEYMLASLCMNGEAPIIKKIGPEELQ